MQSYSILSIQGLSMNPALRGTDQSILPAKFTLGVDHLVTAAGWLLLGIAVFLMSGAVFAESARGAPDAKAQLDFKIVIPSMVRVKALVQPDRITIEQAQVERGYIDLDAASSLLLTSNSRQGYVLSASFDSGLLASVEVKVANQVLRAADGLASMRVDAPMLVDKLVGVSYRLYLKPGVRAGDYRWPVALAFSPSVV